MSIYRERVWILLLTVAMVVTLSAPIVVWAGPQGTVIGKFGTSNSPEITSIIVYEAGTLNVPVSLTPQQEYDISITVTDLDGIGDLESFHVKFWFDSSGTETTEADYDSYVLMQDLSQYDCAVIKWDEAFSNWAYMYAASTGGACTWELDPDYFNIPTSGQRGDPEYTTHEYTYRVKIGKVCRATGGVEKWQIGAKATDKSGGTGYIHWGSGVPMNWYGEVMFRDSLVTGEYVEAGSVEWRSIAPGTDFSSELPSYNNIGVDTHYISNGSYYQQIKAQTVWESQGGSPDAVLSADASIPNSFALKALNNIQLNHAVLVDHGGGWVTLPYDIHGPEYGTITPYSGYIVPGHTNNSPEYPYPANTLWLKLNPVFARDTYSGIITYGIVNQT